MMGRERRVKKTVVMGQSEDMEGTKSEELPGMSGVKHRAAQIRSQKGRCVLKKIREKPGQELTLYNRADYLLVI